MTTEQPTITVRKYAHVVPTDAIGVDEQGCTLVRCPVPGCAEPARIERDGRVVCEVAETQTAILRAVTARMDEWLL